MSHCYLEWYQLLRPHAKRHWGGMSRASPAAQRGALRRDRRPGSTQLATCGSHPPAEQSKRPGLACAMWTSSHQTEKAKEQLLLTKPSQGEGHRQGRKEPSGCTLPQSTWTSSWQCWTSRTVAWATGRCQSSLGSGLWGSVWSVGESPDSPTEAPGRLFPGWFWILTHHHLETGLWALATFSPILSLPVMIIWCHSQQG